MALKISNFTILLIICLLVPSTALTQTSRNKLNHNLDEELRYLKELEDYEDDIPKELQGPTEDDQKREELRQEYLRKFKRPYQQIPVHEVKQRLKEEKIKKSKMTRLGVLLSRYAVLNDTTTEKLASDSVGFLIEPRFKITLEEIVRNSMDLWINVGFLQMVKRDKSSSGLRLGIIPRYHFSESLRMIGRLGYMKLNRFEWNGPYFGVGFVVELHDYAWLELSFENQGVIPGNMNWHLGLVIAFPSDLDKYEKKYNQGKVRQY